MRKIIWLTIFCLLLASVFPQENDTACTDCLPYDSDATLPAENESQELLNATPTEAVDFIPVSDPAAPAEEPIAEEQANATSPKAEAPLVTSFELVNISPAHSKKGDVLLELNFRNTGTAALYNLIPVVVAKGFASYDAVPLSAEPGQLGAAYVSGGFSEAGNILLTIRVSDKIFYGRIEIEEPQKQAQAAFDTSIADALAAEVEQLWNSYEGLEAQMREKKASHDLSEVKIDDLKRYILAAQVALAQKEIDKANLSLIQARTEYTDQQDKVDHAQKKPFLTKIRDNIIVISAIAGAILTIISLYESLKKRQEGIYQRMKGFKGSKASTETKTKTQPGNKV